MKTTNKYPVFVEIKKKTEQVETPIGTFDMNVFKEKCGQAVVVTFTQVSVIRSGKDHPFMSNPMVFKLVDGKMKYDPMGVIKSNFTENVKPDQYEIGYLGSIIHLNDHIKFSKRHLDESVRGE